MDNLGIPRSRTHFVNIFGSVYKLELPIEDILSVEQWEEHKKSEVFRSFLSFVLNDMKYKVTDIHVKFRRTNQPQNHIVEPLISSSYDASSGEHTEADFEDIHLAAQMNVENMANKANTTNTTNTVNTVNTANTAEFSQQAEDDDYRPLGSVNLSNKPVNKPQKISTVF